MNTKRTQSIQNCTLQKPNRHLAAPWDKFVSGAVSVLSLEERFTQERYLQILGTCGCSGTFPAPGWNVVIGLEETDTERLWILEGLTQS